MSHNYERNTLLASVPYFASPIYIGMSVSLRQRLLTHKKLIEKYRESAEPHALNSEGMNAELEAEPEDHSFAKEVALERKLLPCDLVVWTMELDGLSCKAIRCVEYILNRINYPLCGRS